MTISHSDGYGFATGSFAFSPRIFLWVLPTAVLSLPAALASHGQVASGPFGFTKLQTIVFVWVYATICEGVLFRGLFQTLLSGASSTCAPGDHYLSMPVLVSGLSFGLLHIVLVSKMGLKAIPVVLMTTFFGLVAARYREKTGSLLPAMIIHALFNIGGTLPLWAIQFLRT